MAISRERLAALNDRGPDVAELLPYYDYDPDGQVFIQVDGRLGMGWRISPVPSETDSDEAKARMGEVVERLLLEIPQGFCGQFLLEVSGDVDDTLNKFLGASELPPDSLITLLCEGKSARYRDAAVHGFWPGDPYRCRRFAVYLMLISPPPTRTAGGILAWAAKGRGAIAGEIHRDYLARKADLMRQGLGLERGLQGYGFRPERLDMTGLLGIAYRALNPGRARSFAFGNHPPPSPSPARGEGAPKSSSPSMGEEAGGGGRFIPDGRPLREQIAFGNCEVREDHLLLDGLCTQVLSLTGLPGSVGPALINTLLERYTGNLLVAINFVNLTLAESKSALGAKRFLAGRQARSITGQENLAAKVILDELDDVLKEIEGKNRRIVSFAVHVVASSPPAQQAETTDALLRAFSFVGATASIETDVVLPVLLSSLPLGFDPRLDTYLRRLRKVLSDRFVMFLPLWGYFAGTRTPTQLYVSRLGVPVTADPMDCDTSPHGLILATSGAGKSFFTNDMLIQAQRLNPRPFVFIIDVGGSYQKLCEMLDGDYAQIVLKNPTCINPFADELNDASVALWVPLLAQMVRDPESQEPVTRDQKVLFEIALRKAFERKRGEEVFVSDITQALKEEGSLGEGLALKLYPFTRQGRFGAFFDGPTRLRLGNRMTVFDLTEAKDQPDLRGPLMMAVMNLIIRVVRDEAIRGVRKYLMIDEAWAFLKDPAAAAFIQEGYKTFRKYSGLVFVITQDVLDLVQFPAGEAIVSNAPNLFLLKQQPKALETLAKHLHLNPNQVRTIQTVHMRKGYYSEAFVLTTFEGATRDGVLRLVPDPVSYWVSTTDGADVQAFHAAVKETGSKVDAVRMLAEKYPMGVAAGRGKGS
ncbi:MAG: TraC family protein [Nitrospirae bacterium]|nr:TraC family protein [Nitrospirota bacterium]